MRVKIHIVECSLETPHADNYGSTKIETKNLNNFIMELVMETKLYLLG